MKRSPWLASLSLLVIGLPVYSAPVEDQAHVVLTDGQRAPTDPNSDRWLRIFADSTQLPRTHYSVGEMAFWGVCSPFGNTPKDHPEQYRLQKEAGIYAVRYDMPWYGMEQYVTTNMNWYGIDENMTSFKNDGVTPIGVLGYTPAWANGLKDRQFAPTFRIENELVDLTSGLAVISKFPVIISQPDVTPIVVTPDPTPTQRVTEEVISTNFLEGQAPRTSKNPIMVGTETLWVDEGGGYEQWTRVDNLINSPKDAKHYEVDRAGRFRFRTNRYFWDRGKIPVAGSKMKASYDWITTTYQQGTDYQFNHMTGTVTRRISTVTSPVVEENFTSGPLNAAWQWTSAPTTWDVGQTTAGMLRFLPTGIGLNSIGNFLSVPITGEGDYKISLRVNKYTHNGGSSEVGILVWQDNNNWFRYSASSDQGRPKLTRCINGTVTKYGASGELGWMIAAPRWIHIQKNGDAWDCFTSTNSMTAPDGGYQKLYSFTMPLGQNLRVGISAVGTDAGGIEVDQFRLQLPTIGPGKVRMYYDALNITPWTTYVKKTVTHFKDRVKYWELWNEPDQGWCWNGGQDIYAIMLQEGSKAVKEADPTAKVLSGGYAAGSTTHLNTIYNTIDTKDRFDYVAWHPYSFVNQSPDAANWRSNNTNGVGWAQMEAHNDTDKKVFFGEVATVGGVTACGGGMNWRKQTEYGGRLMLYSRRMGYVAGIQWWPGRDLADKGVNEQDFFGSHEGLFDVAGKPKPIYYLYKNVATNKGVLFDLVSYDANSNPVPASATYPVKRVIVGVQDQAAIGSIKVSTSVSGTDSASIPEKVTAREIINPATSGVLFVVAVDKNNPAVTTESWTLTATSATSFTVTGSKSGAQGTATTGQEFTSNNGVVRFTVPTSKVYPVGTKFEFETFRGDGFIQAAVWTNSGSLSGAGDIEVVLPQAVDARYVTVQFTKSQTADNFALDEIGILDASGNNVSQGKLYIVDGQQSYFDEQGNVISQPDDPGPGGQPQIALTMTGLPQQPKPGDSVTLQVTYQNSGNAAAANVLVEFPVPVNTTYKAGTATGGGVYDSATRKLRWVVPTLAAGASGNVAFEVTID